MEAIYSPIAKEELRSFTQEVRKRVREKVEELKDNPTGHENSKLIRIKNREIYRLEIKEERDGKIDHRLIYDIENGKIRVYSVFNRNEGYQEDRISDRF